MIYTKKDIGFELFFKFMFGSQESEGKKNNSGERKRVPLLLLLSEREPNGGVVFVCGFSVLVG